MGCGVWRVRAGKLRRETAKEARIIVPRALKILFLLSQLRIVLSESILYVEIRFKNSKL